MTAVFRLFHIEQRLPKFIPMSFSGVYLDFEVVLFQDTWYSNKDAALSCPLLASNHAIL